MNIYKKIAQVNLYISEKQEKAQHFNIEKEVRTPFPYSSYDHLVIGDYLISHGFLVKNIFITRAFIPHAPLGFC